MLSGPFAIGNLASLDMCQRRGERRSCRITLQGWFPHHEKLFHPTHKCLFIFTRRSETP
jgi:hypothetical protein